MEANVGGGGGENERHEITIQFSQELRPSNLQNILVKYNNINKSLLILTIN